MPPATDIFNGPIALIARANEPIAAQTSDCALILKRTFVRKGPPKSRSPHLYELLKQPHGNR